METQSKQEFTRQDKKRKTSVDLSTYGKVPPQARELEEAVLGAILMESSVFDIVNSILKPESFYVEAHIQIYKAMVSLSIKNEPIDILTTVQELMRCEKLDAVGGHYYVTKLTNYAGRMANAEAHARIIKQKHIQREIIRISGEMISEAYEDSIDVFDLMDNSERRMEEVFNLKSSKKYRQLDSVLKNVMERVEKFRNKPGYLTGITTGIGRLDFVTGGWQNTDFIIVAARPSIGKSAVAGNFARSAAMATDVSAVGIFSLEMEDIQWAQRMLAAESNIDGWKINRGKVDDMELERLYQTSLKKLAGVPIFIDDTPGLNIFDFKTKARRMVLKENVKLIIVDYLQLMSGTGDRGQNREQEISFISRNLKALAKELKIPIIALSQLGREVEKQKSARPQLSSLRESGAIEQDADVVIFLVPVDDSDVEEDASLKDSIHLQIAKHRNGSREDIEVKFVKEIQKIMNKTDWETYRSTLDMPGFVPVSLLNNEKKNKDEDEELPF